MPSDSDDSFQLGLNPDVDTLLLRFPGPLVLRARRRKHIGFILFFLAIFSLGYFTYGHGRLRFDALNPIFLMAVGGLGVTFSALQLSPNANSLLLGRECFVTKTVFINKIYKWNSVSYFRMRNDPAVAYPKLPVVAFSKTDNSTAQERPGHYSYLIENYGYSTQELVRLMTSWQERSLSGKKSHTGA
jgi:hypothetical protein